MRLLAITERLHLLENPLRIGTGGVIHCPVDHLIVLRVKLLNLAHIR